MKKKMMKLTCLCLMVVMLLSMLPAVSAAQSDTIALGQTKTVVIDEEGERVSFLFTPEETGYYVFYSSDNVRDGGNTLDTYGHIYQGEEEVVSNDDGLSDNNFKIVTELTAGTRYTLVARAYGDRLGSMKVHLLEQVSATSMEAFYGLESRTVSVGYPFYIEPEFAPVNGVEEEVTVVSSKPSVVKVDGNRLIPVAAGSATVTVTSESGLKDTMKFTVLAPKNIKVGDKLTVSPLNHPTASYKFVAPKDATYTYYVEGDGCYPSVYDEDFNYITDGEYAENIFVCRFDAEKGKTYYLFTEVYSSDQTFTLGLLEGVESGGIKSVYKEYIAYPDTWVYPVIEPTVPNTLIDWYDVSFTSSDPTVVEVDEVYGEIHCLKTGTATLTATTGSGAKTTFKIKVIAPKELRAVGDYTFKTSREQDVDRFIFIAPSAGDYYIDVYDDYNGGLGIGLGTNDSGAYTLTKGQEVLINCGGTYDMEQSFYIRKGSKPACFTKGHKYVTVAGVAATTLTPGGLLDKCSVCGAEQYKDVKQLKGGKGAEKQFKDVKKKDWFYDAVNFAYNSGLFNGTSKTEFSPNASMTRGMFVTVLGRMSGIAADKKATTKFTDVAKGQYYTPYVKWANEAGIVKGISDTKFAPDANVTREQICVMMEAYLKEVGMCLRNDFAKVKFTDEGKIASWAKKAVLACQLGGIINGEKSGKGYAFNPQGNATRAQVATILHNYVNNYLVPQTQSYYAY